MANIIDQIIQIDSIAQKKLEDAAHLKDKYEEEAKRKIAETNALIDQKAQEKLDSVRQEEAVRAEQEKEALRQQQQEAISRLERIFNETHEKLEQQIYRNVLGL